MQRELSQSSHGYEPGGVGGRTFNWRAASAWHSLHLCMTASSRRTFLSAKPCATLKGNIAADLPLGTH